MVKIVDIDKLFDKYIEKYVLDNIGKIEPEKIEDKISELYVEFGDSKLKELDDKTPNVFYKEYTIYELLDCLKNHIEQNVAISDFLCEAIIDKKENNVIIEELGNDLEEQYFVYLLNILHEGNGELPISRCLELVLYNYSNTITELACESLIRRADGAKESVLKAYDEAEDDKKEILCEILSCAKIDERISKILLCELSKHLDKIPLYVSYIVKYGDSSILPHLYELIESDKISYADFEELRFAIESLGGEYNVSRDFSNDKTYRKIKGIPKKIL